MFIESVRGKEIKKYLDDIAILRISVFREFPYLYDGCINYERTYLEKYFDSSDSLALILFDKSKIVGASTALPMLDADIAFQKAFNNTIYEVKDIFYFAESVILPEYRGEGFGNQFFSLREYYASRLGYNKFVFCSVNRDENHSLRPIDYTELNNWWTRLGYKSMPNIICKFCWKEVGSLSKESTNHLTFWQKGLY